jgi:hypothetical protein
MKDVKEIAVITTVKADETRIVDAALMIMVVLLCDGIVRYPF